MQTDKSKFKQFLRNKGFSVHDVYSNLALIPHYRKTDTGAHNLIDNIVCCMFDGVDTPKGDLGCITFYYEGMQKNKHCKTIYEAEILKKALVCENAQSAISAYTKWVQETAKALNSWKTIM